MHLIQPNTVLVGKTGHDVMRDLAPSILADALGDGGHSVFIAPTQISTPMFDPDDTLAAEDGIEKLVQFLVAFKLAVRAMGASGSVVFESANLIECPEVVSGELVESEYDKRRKKLGRFVYSPQL